MREGMIQPGQVLLTMEILVGMKNLAFCSDVSRRCCVQSSCPCSHLF